MSAIVGNQNLLSLSYRQELKEIEAAFGNTSTTRELARLLSSENPSESLEEGKFEFLNAEEQAFLKELMASTSFILFFIYYLLSIYYFLSHYFLSHYQSSLFSCLHIFENIKLPDLILIKRSR